jgi:two-component sensor histidine kinase
MALIHQDLYGDKNINGIAIHTYIDNLAQNLFKTYNIRPQQVQLTTDIEKINLSADMIIPIGLVMNELISNSLKYAFHPGQPGIIEVILKIKNNHLFLQVKDNGKGFPQNMEQSSYSTFGMRMIKAFAQKLKAHLAVFNDDGACVTMMISHYKVIS